jgi:hypothetical protein
VLNAAALCGDINTFDHLVDRGAIPSRSNALHNAARCEDPAKAVAMIIHLIEKHHLDPNVDDECNGLNELVGVGYRTPGNPLNYAIGKSNIAAVEVLLKYGADASNSLHTAIYEQQGPALKLLLEGGGRSTESLGIAITEDFLEGAELCLQYGANPANGELYEEELRQTGAYDDMTSEMRKLLDEWK